MKILKIKKADNYQDELLDGLATLNHLDETQKYLDKLSEAELGGLEFNVKRCVSNAPKLLKMIKDRLKKK